MAPTPASPADDLLTVRDLLRYAVSRFGAAKLAYGHGTTTALDEAAFMLLEGLSLPIDDLAPWLEARLTRPEREKLLGLIEARVTTRKPAPYLLGRAYIQGVPFRVDERVIIPRSYLGEMMMTGALAGDGAGPVPDPFAVERVLDLCTGSGCLAILAALTFPNAAVDAIDISVGALEVAARNVEDYGLGDRVALHRSDLFAGLEGRTYDLIIANPPYVTAEAVAAFPPEYRAEPELAHLGGDDGLDIVRRILAEAAVHLNTEGMLVVEVGMAREALETEYPSLPFLWLDTEQSEGELFALSADALRRQGGDRRRKA